MKKLFTVFLFLISFVAISQTYGNYHLTGIIEESESRVFEKWIDHKNNSYAIYFEQTPIGIKHAYEKIGEILKVNNLDASLPTTDKTLLASYVSGLNDIENLSTSINLGDSEVIKAWRLSYRSLLLVLKKDRYQIFLM